MLVSQRTLRMTQLPHTRVRNTDAFPDSIRSRPLGLSVAGRAGRHAPEYALAAPLTGQDWLADRDGFELSVPLVLARKRPIPAAFLSPLANPLGSDEGKQYRDGLAAWRATTDVWVFSEKERAGMSARCQKPVPKA
jgi:hypothetical protein